MKKESFKILIADNDLSTRLLIKDILELEGYETLESSSAQESSLLIHQQNTSSNPVHIGIMDSHMPPGETGKVVKEINLAQRNKLLSPIKFILLCSIPSDKIIPEINEFKKVIDKPFNIAELIDSINQIKSKYV